jgi:pimeloyl-ACP methyl ester carboxylesterase/membrane protein DedA with SNARE-associated domain
MRIGFRILKRVAAVKWWLLAAYLVLIIVSDLKRWHTFKETIASDVTLISVPAINHDRATGQLIRLAFKEYNANPQLPAVVLLQGSPGNHRDFTTLGPELAGRYRVIAPDLPGFGSSTHSIPDYSNRAHARYVLEMLDHLHIQRAHFVGFSMGGGVALNIADIAPERVSSLTMLSGIGVQEMELLGNYYLNHSIHGAQLAFLWFLREGTPHFGLFDHSMLDISYARNFYDTDQRPLRSILSHFSGPMLIIHGERDVMVPVEVAKEAYRLVPQSELVLFPDENHFYVFARPQRQAAAALDFFDRVEKGNVRLRGDAEASRIALAMKPFDPAKSIPPAMGPTALLIFGLLALSTLISEDLTCVWAGVLAAEGRIGLVFAAVACLLGIFVGDIMLFLAGRWIGRPLLRHAPLKWFLRQSDVDRCSSWFQRRGMRAIFLSRFLPGTRLPTYFAAGLLDTSLITFSFYFFVAAALWTPLLVGTSMVLGRQVIEATLITQQALLLRLIISALLIFVTIRLLIRLTTFRGRRLLVGRWRRITRWEFWPPWVFYPPVLVYILFLGVKHRNLTLFTCANPAIEDGGFVGESKSAILRGLCTTDRSSEVIPRFTVIRKSLSVQEKIETAECFMRQQQLAYPVVLKPDSGERGSGVAVVRSSSALRDYLHNVQRDLIIQQHIEGFEFGVFYYRYPSEDSGHIFSITRKLFPSVVGDGHSTLEQLILKDARAVAMLSTYADAQRGKLDEVPEEGKSVQLIEIGTHCRGSIFLDGIEIRTPEMEAAFDSVSKGMEGFYFGRFDVRTPSIEDFQAGRNFKVIELNGVTSEATHIYDPRNSLLGAYQVLFNQWRIAFEIGAQARSLGAQPSPVWRLAKLVVEKWRTDGERFEVTPRPINIQEDSASQYAAEN